MRQSFFALLAVLNALAQTPAQTPAPTEHQHEHAPAVATPKPAGDAYSCPMHPDVRSATPGKCAKCGMALETAKPVMAPPAATGPKLTLADLERMALGQSPVMGQAQAMVEAAAGRTQQAGLWPNPSFGANGEHVSKVTGGGAIGGFVEQRFITAGKLGLSRKVAQQEQAGYVEMQNAQKQRLLNGVRALYYQALGDQLLIDVRQELTKLASRAVAVSRELANVGQADRPDLLAAETESERIELELVAAQNARQRTWRQLAATVNQPSLRPGPLEGDLESIPQLDAEQALEAIYRESPELRAAEVAVRRSEFTVRRAEVEKRPDIFIRGGLRNNREFGEVGPFGPTRRRGLEGIFDVSVQIPIFNRNQGGVKAAKAEAEHARLEVNRTKLSLQARLAAEYKDYLDSRLAVERYRTRILPKARQAYDLYLANFRQMAGAYPQALIAQRNLFQLQDSYIAALVNTWQRAVQIQGLLLGSNGEMALPRAAANREDQ